jgi:hypothetical protein
VLRYPRFALALLVPLALLAGACDTVEAPPPPFDFERFFAAPTPGEVSAVLMEWEGRAEGGAYDPGPVAVVFEGDLVGDGSRVYVLRHTTGDYSASHYGAVRVPEGAGPFPVLVVNHGGDRGLALAEYLGLVSSPEASPFGAAAARAITVFPTFRSETMRTPEGLPDFTAGGEASPWDRDVDDALALLNATFVRFGDLADPGRVATLGISRGGAVSLLMALRPLPPGTPYRIRGASVYYPPTDLFSPVLQLLAVQLILQEGSPFEGVPGARFLQREVLRPVQRGELSYEAGRREAIRRSAAYFASRLENVQVHHHRRDGVVPFDQFQALAARRAEIGGETEFLEYGTPGPTEVRFHAYGPDVMPQSAERTNHFLSRLLYP